MDTQPHSPVDELLEQRAQYQQWLTRLDQAGSKASDTVRQRVRSDYQRRLDGVVEQLKGHASSVADELERHRATQRDLESRQSESQDRLAEAEVRHVVGEYPDSEWERIRSEHQGALDQTQEELTRVLSEIARLEEVQRLIEAPAEAPALPPPAAAPEPAKPAPPPAQAAEAPRFEPPSAGPAGDELAFLKSVTAETPARRAPAAPSGGAGESGAGRATAAGTGTGAKTLKCGECGTLNRPTEWYCEQCGAELAAL